MSLIWFAAGGIILCGIYSPPIRQGNTNYIPPHKPARRASGIENRRFLSPILKCDSASEHRIQLQQLGGFSVFTYTLRSGSGGPPDLLDSKAKTPPKQGSQNRAFRISDTRRDLVDGRAAGLQKMHRALYPQTLEVR